MVLQRLRKIFRANWNEGGAAEFADSEVNAALCDMGQAVEEARREAARALAEARLAAQRLGDQRRQASQWQQAAEHAVRLEDDASARAALRNRQACDTMISILEEQAAAATEASQILRQKFESMQAQLAEARLQAGSLTARHKAAEVRRRHALPAFDTAAFAKYERLSSRMDQLEAEAAALRELTPAALPTCPTVAEGGAGQETDLDTELAELRRRLRAKQG